MGAHLKDSRLKDKKEDVKIAKELHYPKVVIRMLEDEDNPYKRQNILTGARNGIYDKIK